jgi:hypothetical protein
MDEVLFIGEEDLGYVKGIGVFFLTDESERRNDGNSTLP